MTAACPVLQAALGKLCLALLPCLGVSGRAAHGGGEQDSPWCSVPLFIYCVVVVVVVLVVVKLTIQTGAF